jgi:hypothetical protein
VRQGFGTEPGLPRRGLPARRCLRPTLDGTQVKCGYFRFQPLPKRWDGWLLVLLQASEVVGPIRGHDEVVGDHEAAGSQLVIGEHIMGQEHAGAAPE